MTTKRFVFFVALVVVITALGIAHGARAGQPAVYLPGIVQRHIYHVSISPAPGTYSLDNFNMSAVISLDSGQCYGAWLNFRTTPDVFFQQYHNECVLQDGKYRASLLISFYAPVKVTDVYACMYDGQQTFCQPVNGQWSFGQ